MPLCRLICLLVVVACVGFAPAPFPRREKRQDDFQAIQGIWKVVVYESNGAPLTNNNLRVRIEGLNWHFYRENNGQKTPSSTYALRLEPKASPAAFDWSQPHNVQNPMYIGSYLLERKRLTIVFGNANQPRPTDFATRMGYRMVMERP
jgi:uncharacterized protein (TIGR03067 family)